MHAVGTKGGKTRASESRLVSGLLLIGWKNGASFLSQSLKVEQMQITFRHSRENHPDLNSKYF